MIEVLVAFAVFVIMVGALTWFIKVWMDADLEQRARNDALTAVSNCLERVTAGLMLQDEVGAPRIEFHGQRVPVQQAMAVAPEFVDQLNDDERPATYQVVAMGQLYNGQQVRVQVTG